MSVADGLRHVLYVALLASNLVGCQTAGSLVRPPTATEGGAEFLEQRGDRVTYGKCRPSGTAVCEPDLSTTSELSLSDYRQALRELLALQQLETRLATLRAEERALASRLDRQRQELATTLAVPVRPGVKSAAREAAAREDADRGRASIASTEAELTTLRQGKGATAEKALGAGVARHDDVLRALQAGGRLRGPGARTPDIAFAPFRYSPSTCPEGSKWQGDACCQAGRCRHHHFAAPGCRVEAAPTAVGVALTLTLTDGPASFVTVQGRTVPIRERRLVLQASSQQKARTVETEETFSAAVRGPGGGARCDVALKLDPSCPSSFRWSEERGCCARWLRCTCGALTARGYAWECQDGGGWREGDVCHATGNVEERLTCFAELRN